MNRDVDLVGVHDLRLDGIQPILGPGDEMKIATFIAE
jgi:hypothetical protein